MGCGSSIKVEQEQTPTPAPPTPPPPRTPTPPPPRTPTPPPPRTPTPPPRQNTADFASDSVDIIYDDRKDEHPVPKQESNDPAPFPVDPNNDNICKDSNHFFEDEDFQLSSDDADMREVDNVQDDDVPMVDDTMSVNIPLIQNPGGYHIPKISFVDVDEHARTANDEHSSSFESLREYLTNKLSGEHKELLTARAIVVWLSHQDIDKKYPGEPTLLTPRGLLQCLRMNKISYATCYVILCRSAGLSCTYINGIVKAAGYEPGDTHAPSSPWTAVYADGAWRIVHPFWVCRALFGHSLAGWVKVERDGQSTSQRTQASKGIARNAFQEHYFMPRPEHFVHKCFPEDTNWELLPKSLRVETKQDFFDLPYLLPPFFGLGLELTSERKCHLVTKHGRCKIQIKGKASNGHMLVLAYELFVKESEIFDAKNIQRMVFNSRSKEYFSFDIRFPVRGLFKLVIYGGPFKSPLLRLCEFKITCNEPMSGINLLPLSCSNLGWGPGPASVDAGLLLPSRPNGEVVVPKNTRQTDIAFSIKKKFVSTSTYAAILLDGSEDADEKTFERCVKTEISQESKRLNIAISLPSEGEFGLRITITTPRSVRVVCNYLLSTAVYKHEKPEVRIARQRLKESVLALEQEKYHQQWKTRIDECNERLDKCREKRIAPSDEDICIATTTIDLYTYKNALRDSIARRNMRVIHAVLYLVSKYKDKMAIEEDIQYVERFKDKLKALRRCSSEVQGLHDAFALLSGDVDPPYEVLSVYRAVLYLLGVSKNDTKTWELIKGKLGDSAMILRRLERIHDSDISQVDRKRAQCELSSDVEMALRREHEHVYFLYNWIKSVLNIYNPGQKKH